jgi:regulator of protease activity HflC (stomatin/prohibitin superfamily)
VNEGEVVIIEKLGKFQRVLKPGLHFNVPYIFREKSVYWTRQAERPDGQGSIEIYTEIFHDYRIPTSEKCYDIPSVKCFTMDNVPVEVNIVIYYVIIDAKKSVYNIDDLFTGIQNIIETTLIDVIRSLDSNSITSNKVEAKMIEYLKKNTEWKNKWGIELTKAKVQEVELPQSLVNATTKIITERRRAEAKKLSIESKYEGELLKLQGDKDVLLMQQEIDMATLRGSEEYEASQHEHKMRLQTNKIEAEVHGKKLRVKAETEALQKHYLAIKDSGLSENYFIQKMYSEAWNSITQNGKTSTLIVPYEAASFLGGQKVLKTLHPDIKSHVITKSK